MCPPTNSASFTGAARQLLFEHSPGRGNPKFTGDYAVFDPLIRYSDCQGRNLGDVSVSAPVVSVELAALSPG
jgi:hypothetical protein